MRFQFTKTDSLSEESIIYADASALYPHHTEAGTFSYGFVTQEIVRENADLQIPELNSGFEAFEWFAGADPFRLTQNDFGVGSQYDGQGQLPLIFSSKVPTSGNYELCIRFYAMNDTDNVVIFAGRRRLVWIGDVSAGQFYTVRCIENVSPVIPRFHSEKMEDTSVRIALLGKGIFLNSLSFHVWEGPTVYIAGDSTVTDQTGCYPYFPEHCYSGWGQMLSAYLKCDMAVSNHAHSGLTTESFRSEGHYDIMHSLIKAGDYVFFQFAHNDQKLPELTADGGYRNNLLRYISEIKEIGATPVLVTPLARNTWFGNREEYNDLLLLYAEECKKIASEEQIPLIDLHGRVK
ncbi:MAG: hypothetical protein K6B69_13310, partial [Lachnospiraceae bacterium]|nr:hypothetical protein [Lachnospiraceae bacterium]